MSTIFTAEASAILEAVKICNSNNHLGIKAIVTDRLSTLEELVALSLRKSEIVRKIHNLIHQDTILIWVPSHMGIKGNNFADKIAGQMRQEHDSDPFTDNHISEGDYKLTIKFKLNAQIQQLWNSKVQNKFQLIHPSIEYENVWETVRKDVMIVNRIRAGHTFLTHSHLISYDVRKECQHCNEYITVEHLFECEVDYDRRYRSCKELGNWREDIFNKSKFEAIKQFLKVNGVYGLI